MPRARLRYESPVQSPRAWHRDRVAERDSLLEPMDAVPAGVLFCQLCGIGIGPDHLEQALYLYPAERQWICDKDDNYVFVTDEWLLCCGGCAQDKRRHLPEMLCLLDYREWDRPLAQARASIVYYGLWLVLFTHAFPSTMLTIAWAAVVSCNQPENEELDAPQVTVAAQPRGSFARGMRRTSPAAAAPTIAIPHLVLTGEAIA